MKIINKNKDGDSNQQEADLPYQIYVKYPVICALVKIIKRLILLVFSLLGLCSSYVLIYIYITGAFSDEKINADLVRTCGVMPLDYDPAYGICWDAWQTSSIGPVILLIFLVVLVIIGIPSIKYLYKLLKKDFIQLRLKYKK